MSNILNTKMLEAMGTQFVVLGIAGYALPVPFRVRGPIVECRVPIWSGVGELLEEEGDVTLVAVQNSGTNLCWLFIRGSGTVIKDPDWEGFVFRQSDGVERDYLYQLLRIEPKRMELFDEQRGWGFRETADF